MRTRRWVAATAAGILLLAGAPVAAAADEADECADAGLISSLLGKCGLLGAVFGGSESDDEPGAEEPSTPGPAEEDGTGASGGTSGGTPDGSGGTSRGTGGTSDDAGGTSSGAGGADGGSGPAGPYGDTTGPSGGTSTSSGEATATDLGPIPAGTAPGSSARGPAGSSAEADRSNPAAAGQVVGPLAPIPRDGDTAEAAPLTRPVEGLTLALVAAGVLVAIAVVATARRRSATKPTS